MSMTTSENPLRIVLYTCNIGRYRNEHLPVLSLHLSAKDPSIRYVYCTDDPSVQSSFWEIEYCDPDSYAATHDPAWGSRSRWIAKCIKWRPPATIVDGYDIVLYLDSKCVRATLPHVTRQWVEHCLRTYPGRGLFMVGHSERSTMQAEALKILSINRTPIENLENARRFQQQNLRFDSPFPLCDTCFRMERSDHPRVRSILSHIVTLLQSHGLRRDQLVFNYAFQDAPLEETPVILPIDWNIVQSIYAPYKPLPVQRI